MKRVLALFLTIVIIASVPVVLADKSPLLPYEGDEVVYNGFWDEYTQTFHDFLSTVTPLDEALHEEVGNVRIQWDPIFSDARQKLDLMMATGDLPDIIVTVHMYDRLKMYDMGNYLDLREYAEYAPNLMAAYEDYPPYSYLKGENGEIWWIPQQVTNDATSENWYVNREALDALGIDTPRTWDEVKDAMRLYKEQNPDKYPLLRPYWSSRGLFDIVGMIGFTQGYESYGVYYDTTASEWKFGLNEPNAHVKETLEEIISMFAEGFFPEDALTRSRDQGYDTLVNGDFLFMYAYTGETFGGIAENLPYSLEPIALDIPVPVGYHRGRFNYDGGLINADVENPELLVSLVDYWQSEEVQMMNAMGLRDVTYTIDENGKRTYLPEYQTEESQLAFGIRALDEAHSIFSYARWTPLQIPSKSWDELTRGEKCFVTVIDWLNEDAIPIVDHDMYYADISVDDNEIVSANLTPIKTYIEENFFNFITGARPMSEWDAFVEETQAYGDIGAILDIYNNSNLLTFNPDYQWMDPPEID